MNGALVGLLLFGLKVIVAGCVALFFAGLIAVGRLAIKCDREDTKRISKKGEPPQ